jgi:hypothetical protein
MEEWLFSSPYSLAMNDMEAAANVQAKQFHQPAK